MKKCLLFLILNSQLLIFNSFAQSPNWLWAKSAGGTSWDGGNGVSTDAGGNVYVTGFFDGPSITFGTSTLTNVGNSDVFIVKYDSSGTVLWAKSAGGTSNDNGWGVSTGAGGNVYVTGWFYSPSITFGTTTLTNAGSADMFIVKYDSSGIMLWAKSAGGTSQDIGYGVSTDALENVYVTGFFQSSSITFGTTVLTNAGTGTSDIYIVKFDSSGTMLWAKSAGGTGDDWAQSISTDAGGNVYVTGWFNSPSTTFGTTTLTNVGGYDIFIVKFDSPGTMLWAKSAGSTGNDWGHGVSTDAGGNVYVTGTFGSPSITFGTTTLTNAGSSDFFIAKYDSSGIVLWVKAAGGTNNDVGYGVSIGEGGNVYVTGVFISPSITFGTTVLTNAGTVSSDMFIAKYDSSGTMLWAKSAGGTGNDYGQGVSTHAGGNVHVTGWFDSPSITFGTTTLTSAGDYDMFIAKLDTSLITGNNEIENFSNSILLFANPISYSTTISFSLSQSQKVSLKIFDVNGRLVSTLADKVFEVGEHQIEFNAEKINAGIYFLKIESDGFNKSEKIIVTK